MVTVIYSCHASEMVTGGNRLSFLLECDRTCGASLQMSRMDLNEGDDHVERLSLPS